MYSAVELLFYSSSLMVNHKERKGYRCYYKLICWIVLNDRLMWALSSCTMATNKRM